jgi:RHS repeat-associated protein
MTLPIQVSASDPNNKPNFTELEGSYKLGNFNMSFTDLDLQLGGLPITITRTYDTLNADVQGDFGYGWSLDIATTEISVVIGNGANAQKGFSRYEPIQDGTHITITLPDGTKEGFTFQPKSANSSSSPFAGIVKTPYYYPAWIPDVGTKSTLAVPQILMYAWGDGTYYMMDDYGDGMNDYSPAAGSAFLTLTLRNGVDLVIDATTGKLCEAVDLTGSKLTFSDHGITHSSGKGVVFERDYEGRISAITGPDGRRVEYSYDNKGDLVAVKDQSNATVQFTYLTDPKAPEHYLDQVIDPLGRTAAKTEFDEQGRIKKVIDAEGKVIEYDFDTESRIQKVTDQLGNTTIIENDDQGNVIREVSPEGNITLHTYDNKGNTLSETTVVIHNGQEIQLTTSYTYDSDGNKLSETDARGNVTTYVYNKYGQVTSTTSNGITTITNYDQNTGLPKTTVDANGNSTTYGFDSKGNMTSLVNSNGVQLITSTYNKYGEVTSITSTNGRTTYMEYDNNGDNIATYYVENGVKVLDETICDNARKVVGRKHYIAGELIWETKTEYNVAGQVVKEIDQNGLITLYTYDIRGLETEVRSQSKGTDGQIQWNIQRTVYDAAGRSTHSNSYAEGINVTKIDGSHTEYDGDGRSIRNEQLLGLVIELDSNGRSFVKSSGTVISSSSTEYNSAGWVLSSTDSNGLKTEYVYNVFGETTQTRRELIGGGWIVSETVYDSQGRVVFSTDSHVEGSTDPVYGTKSLYDSKGRSIGSVRYKGSAISLSADGAATVAQYGTEIYRTTTEYDNKGRVKSSTDAYGNTTTYEYDNLDRQVIVKQADGIITETVYDKQGRVWKSVIKVGNDVRTTEYKYDMYGNIIETIQPDGTTIKAAYNNKGQKISETNQLGQTRTFEYDDNGQLIKVTLPDGATYKYAYDAQGNQTSIIDPLSRETTFTYDDDGNQLTRTLPDGSTEYFEYDFKGRLIKQTSFENVVTTYQYDDFDRLSSKTFTANGITETWIYTYDQFGRVNEIDQAGRIVKTTYDAQGRTILIETPEGKIAYSYDMFGRQTSVQTDDDLPVVYTYDNLGRLSSVTSDGKTTIYEYDAFGNLARTQLPNGVITTYEYDNMNRLIKETNFVDKNNNGILDNGEGVSQFSYELDKQGRKLSAKEKFWIEFGQQENNIDWIYDDAGRLIYEKFDHYDDAFDQTSEWIYDLVGNRLRQTVDKGNDGTVDNVTKYTYDKNDRLLKEQHDAQNDGNFEKTTAYGYDHTQQTSKTVVVDGVKLNETTYEYNLQGRMAVVTITTFADDGTPTKIERTVYEYGEDGIRTSALHEIDVDGDGIFDTAKLTEYLNDPLSITGYSQVLKQTEADLQTNEQTVTTYVIGHQRISQTVIKDGLKQEYYFTLDGHGSTRVLTDIVGSIVELYAYDAFGNAIGFDPSIALTEFLYSGEQFDSKIGQQYLRQRYYDPATGRFNRLDPFFGNLNDPLSLHKYLYTHGDPVNGVDPNGLMSMGGMVCAMGIGGALVGGSFGAYRDGVRGAIVGAFAGGIAGVAIALASPALAGFFGTSFWGGVGFGTTTGGLGGAINGLVYGTLLKNGEFGFHLRHGLGMAVIEGGMGAIAGGVFAGVVPFAGLLVGRIARPVGVANQQLKESMMGLANSPAFRSRAEYWTRLTGRPAINWDKFISKLDNAIYETNEGFVSAWAGLDETGERLFFSISKYLGNQSQSHELFHGLQEFIEPGLVNAAQQGNLGPFSIAAIEASANLYGNPAIGFSATGIGTTATTYWLFPAASAVLDYFMYLGEFND